MNNAAYFQILAAVAALNAPKMVVPEATQQAIEKSNKQKKPKPQKVKALNRKKESIND